MDNQLTDREKEVFSLLKEGFLAKAIAQKLKVKHNTVLTHLKRIEIKTGVNKPSQAKAYIFPPEVEEKREITARYTGWSKAGIYCELSKQHCDGCPIWRFYKLRKGKGCYQPFSNESIKNKDIEFHPTSSQRGSVYV